MPGPADPEDPAAPPKRRRRVRTALLITAALLLGTLAGAGTGYEIQHRREPTPLPPLAVDKPAYPAEHTKAGPVLHRTDQDLRKLLLDRPKGAEDWPIPQGADGWLTLAEYASTFEQPDKAFQYYGTNGFRRVAFNAWRKGDIHVELNLLQFRERFVVAGLDDLLIEKQGYMPDQTGQPGERIPGTPGGYVYVFAEPYREAAQLPVYQGTALARRGDVMVQIVVSSPDPVSSDYLVDLAKRQLERL